MLEVTAEDEAVHAFEPFGFDLAGVYGAFQMRADAVEGFVFNERFMEPL